MFLATHFNSSSNKIKDNWREKTTFFIQRICDYKMSVESSEITMYIDLYNNDPCAILPTRNCRVHCVTLGLTY